MLIESYISEMGRPLIKYVRTAPPPHPPTRWTFSTILIIHKIPKCDRLGSGLGPGQNHKIKSKRSMGWLVRFKFLTGHPSSTPHSPACPLCTSHGSTPPVTATGGGAGAVVTGLHGFVHLREKPHTISGADVSAAVLLAGGLPCVCVFVHASALVVLPRVHA